MYNPKTYMTLEVVLEIVSSFEWPASFTLEDELPDGIVMQFPNSNLMFVEGFESEMDLVFLTEDTGTTKSLGFTHALMAIVPESSRSEDQPLTPGLIRNDPPAASLEKVRDGLRDLCTIALHHLQPCILGDFSWVAKYEAIASMMETE